MSGDNKETLKIEETPNEHVVSSYIARRLGFTNKGLDPEKDIWTKDASGGVKVSFSDDALETLGYNTSMGRLQVNATLTTLGTIIQEDARSRYFQIDGESVDNIASRVGGR